MGIRKFLKEFLHYFVRLPVFSARVSLSTFRSIDDIVRICPEGPRSPVYREAVEKACADHGFLRGQEPGNLFELYNLISTVREADVFLYPFLNGRTVHKFNTFHNIGLVRELYERGPVLILYAHTGSIYQTGAAMGALGFTVHPIAFVPDLSGTERPFRWLYNLNLKWSERLHSGGHYLYARTPAFSRDLRKILTTSRKTLIFSLPDLPRAFVTEKRQVVDFLGGRSAFPSRLIEMFRSRGLPIVLCLASVEFCEGSLKRVVRYAEVPENLTASGILQFYASKLDDFIRRHPEQLLMLINLEGYFA